MPLYQKLYINQGRIFYRSFLCLKRCIETFPNRAFFKECQYNANTSAFNCTSPDYLALDCTMTHYMPEREGNQRLHCFLSVEIYALAL